MCLKQIQTYNNYPTKISTIIAGSLITPILYNSKLYNSLYTSIPLTITSIIYHIFEYKKIILLDKFFCVLSFLQMNYYSFYYSTNNISQLLFMNVLFTYIVCRLLSYYYQSYFWKLHAFMHLLTIPSTLYLTNHLK